MSEPIAENESQLQHEWSNAEGLATKGNVGASAVTVRLPSEKATDCGEEMFLCEHEIWRVRCDPP